MQQQTSHLPIATKTTRQLKTKTLTAINHIECDTFVWLAA